MERSSKPVLRRSALGAMVTVVAAVLVSACIPPPPSSPTPTTTTVPTDTIETVTDASLEWTISQEVNNGSFAPGQVNFWNAGPTPATDDASYLATDGDVTVLKRGAADTFIPIGSSPEVSYANRNRNGLSGLVATAVNAVFLDQKLLLTGGEGTVDTATGEASIEWAGSFTINFYGIYVPFTLSDVALTVDAAGNGELTAIASGEAQDMGDPDAPGIPLPETPVVLADLPDVYASGNASTGFADAPTAFLGTSVTVSGDASPQAPLLPSNEHYWGSWPQSFVDFQIATNLSSYWYTSGLATVDPHKPQTPVSVSFNLAD